MKHSEKDARALGEACLVSALTVMNQVQGLLGSGLRAARVLPYRNLRRTVEELAEAIEALEFGDDMAFAEALETTELAQNEASLAAEEQTDAIYRSYAAGVIELLVEGCQMVCGVKDANDPAPAARSDEAPARLFEPDVVRRAIRSAKESLDRNDPVDCVALAVLRAAVLLDIMAAGKDCGDAIPELDAMTERTPAVLSARYQAGELVVCFAQLWAAAQTVRDSGPEQLYALTIIDSDLFNFAQLADVLKERLEELSGRVYDTATRQ